MNFFLSFFLSFFPSSFFPLRSDGILHADPSGNHLNSDDAKLLTKGDNNAADDSSLYARGQDYLERKDIVGSVVGYVPFVGYVTIMLSEHPWMKTVMLGIMGLVVVLQRE